MITVDMFRLRFPEFAGASEQKIEMFIEDAVIEMGEDTARWLTDKFYKLSQAYLVAHYVEIAGGAGLGDGTPAMPLKESNVAGVEVKFATELLSGSGELGSTSYGMRYTRYRRMALSGARMGWTP